LQLEALRKFSGMSNSVTTVSFTKLASCIAVFAQQLPTSTLLGSIETILPATAPARLAAAGSNFELIDVLLQHAAHDQRCMDTYLWGIIQ
jgi:hypothetical protein